MNKSEIFLLNEQIVQDYVIFKGHQGELGQIGLSELLERYRSHSFLDDLRFKSPEFNACEMAISRGCPESILIADLCRIIMEQQERILEMLKLIPIRVDNLGDQGIMGDITLKPLK